jgi:hypothetical protein
MSRYKKAFAGVRQWSRLLDLHAEGYTPEQLKDACTRTLVDVLEDGSAVDVLRRDHLIAEAINLLRIFEDPWSTDNFWFCLDLHRRANLLSSKASIAECARWELAIGRGLAHYWSSFQLEQPKGDLALEDFAAEAFRNIGSLLESTTQPLLRELLGQLRLTRGKTTENIAQLDFGVVVSELESTSGADDLFSPKPWGVPLSQWRNIAQHHNFVVEGDAVKVRYGKGDRIRELDLSREDLWSLLRLIFRIQSLIKSARTIFVLDHRERFRSQATSAEERPDALAFGFATVMASQGFDVVHFEVQPERARAVVRDVTEIHPYIRQFHASQLVQNLWAATGATECELEYQQRDGTPTLVTIASAADCDAVGKELIDIGEFGRRVTFRQLAICARPTDLEEQLRK